MFGPMPKVFLQARVGEAKVFPHHTAPPPADRRQRGVALLDDLDDLGIAVIGAERLVQLRSGAGRTAAGQILAAPLQKPVGLILDGEGRGELAAVVRGGLARRQAGTRRRRVDQLLDLRIGHEDVADRHVVHARPT